jgi:putative ABC transport system substrate-binding protein
MKRREFIALLGGAATTSVSWPLAVNAQQVERLRRVGILMLSAPSDTGQQPNADRIRQQLEGLGLVDGRNIRIDLRWSDADPEKVR